MTKQHSPTTQFSRFVLPALAVALAWWGYPQSAQASSFIGLGDLPGGDYESRQPVVSANGNVVVGTSRSGDSDLFLPTSLGEAFRWTESLGMVGLGDLPGGIFSSRALDVSADGSVIVGSGRSSTIVSGVSSFAVRWTEQSGIETLVVASGKVIGISDDGGTVVSLSRGGWSAIDRPSMSSLGVALDISANGLAVVGQRFFDSGGEAFRWENRVTVRLGDLPGGRFDSKAFAVSGDGSVVVGFGSSANITNPALREAFRWTEGGGMVGLGDLPGGEFGSIALAVTPGGSVIVGLGNTELGEEAFIWDSFNGIRNLRQVLVVDYGLDLTGWMLTSATSISANGITIVGDGINPDGNTEAWRAVLPEPGTAALVLTLGTLFGATRRKAV